MEIWILVIVLLVISIILMFASFFGSKDSALDNRIDEIASQQSEELYQIKSRLAELEKKQQTSFPTEDIQIASTYEAAYQTNEDSKENVSDNEYEEIIRLYSQGYTMHEIGQAVQKNKITVQNIIDEYIENR